MSETLSYPSGLASLFVGHARTIKRIITIDEVNAAFDKAWNFSAGDDEFVRLYHAYEQLKAD